MSPANDRTRRRPRRLPELEALESRALLSGSVPTPISPFDPFVGNTADNVPGQPGTNNPNSQVEPMVTVNPLNSNNIVSIWQQDRWSNGAARGNEVGVSMDGGKSWTGVVIPGISQASGGTVQRVSDPWLSFSPNGTLFASSLIISQLDANGNPAETGVEVSKSTDGGFTWSFPIKLIDTVNPMFLNDKETITADPTNSNFAYSVWDQLNANGDNLTLLARTTNGGQSWEQPFTILDSGPLAQTIGNQILVLPDGTLVDAFTNIDATTGTITVEDIRSTDHGVSWSQPFVVGQVDTSNGDSPFVVDPDNPQNPIPGGDTIPEFAVDPRNGNLFAVWQDGPHLPNSSGAVIISFATSTDGGQTWSTPIKVNQTPTNIPLLDQQAFDPSVSVAPDGTVAVTYYDFRNNSPAPGIKTDYFAATANPNDPSNSPGGLTNPANWNHEIRITSDSFNLDQGPISGGPFVGDYQGLAPVGPGKFLAVFGEAGVAGAGTSAIFAKQFSTGGGRLGAHIAALDTLDLGLLTSLIGPLTSDSAADPFAASPGPSTKKGHTWN
jgi:hypothetical protein